MSFSDDPKTNRIIKLIFVILVISAVTSTGATVLTASSIPSAPFHYDDPIAVPLESRLCPGEMLRWKLRATVHRAPVIVEIVQVWWSVEKERAALMVAPPVYSVQREIRSFIIDAVLPVPSLPPGRYEYLLAAQESASGAQVQAVPFEIREGCPNAKS